MNQRVRLKLLKDEIKKPYFITLKEWLWEQGLKGPNDTPMPLKIYPARKAPWCSGRPDSYGISSFVTSPTAKDIYSWSNFTPLGKVKVVIIGQDPYHGARQAHGKCSIFTMPRSIDDFTHNIMFPYRVIVLCTYWRSRASVLEKCAYCSAHLRWFKGKTLTLYDGLCAT